MSLSEPMQTAIRPVGRPPGSELQPRIVRLDARPPVSVNSTGFHAPNVRTCNPPARGPPVGRGDPNTIAVFSSVGPNMSAGRATGPDVQPRIVKPVGRPPV
jgi:hypothetical protein